MRDLDTKGGFSHGQASGQYYRIGKQRMEEKELIWRMEMIMTYHSDTVI